MKKKKKSLEIMRRNCHNLLPSTLGFSKNMMVFVKSCPNYNLQPKITLGIHSLYNSKSIQ
jgi:hypothetical protein